MKQIARPLLVFLDTEFTGEDNLQLISIGLATEDGRTFYAELSDGWHVESDSEWVVKNVLPLLQGGSHAKDREEAGGLLAGWLKSLSRRVRVVTDTGSRYDWPLMLELLKGQVPTNLCPTPLDVFSLDYPEFEREILEEKDKRLNDSTLHHALHDALALKDIWEIYKANLSECELESLIAGSDNEKGR